MQFAIEEDGPERIRGWVVPDRPSALPALVADIGRGGTRRLVATDPRPALLRDRRHPSGRCGFEIRRGDPLFDDDRLMLFEAGSHMLVYRRAPANPIEVRLYFQQTQSSPVYDLERELRPLFRMTYGACETVAEEALRSILGLDFTPSLLVSGLVPFRRAEPFVAAPRFRRVTLLSEPYREPASRILRIRALAEHATPGAAWRRLGQGPLIDALARVDLGSRRALDRALARLTDEARLLLADPVTRLLAARIPGEILDERHAQIALERLAGFDLVGFDDDLSTFLSGLEGLIGAPGALRQRPRDPPELVELSALLATCPAAEPLLRLDTRVLSLAREALGR
ncbi:MAG: hypothetical protein JO048_09250 [Methylobacteriaceae bacterium]|nr:hypothetical protein [Methylobacteriaceae bacterium]